MINDKSIDIIMTDIPYGINFDDWDVLHKNTNTALMKSHKSMDNTSFKKRGKPINGWNKSDKNISYEYQEWCSKWAKEFFRITKEGSPVLIFSSRRYLHRVSCALEDQGFLIRDVLIWEKNKCNAKAQRINKVLHKRGIFDEEFENVRLGNLKPMYEPVVWAMKPYNKTLTDCVIENRVGGFVGENGSIPSNIFKFDSNRINRFHPTEKPVELMKELIKVFSISKSNIILDPFCGSGTTLVACKELGREYIGIEKDEEYYKLAQNRILQHSNSNVSTDE